MATHPSMLYDCSLSNTYSDLDISRLDASPDVRHHFAKSLWLDGRYRYADFTDDAPYLYDGSGSVSIYQMALGSSFSTCQGQPQGTASAGPFSVRYTSTCNPAGGSLCVEHAPVSLCVS